MSIALPVPHIVNGVAQVNGGQLAAEIEAAGYTNVNVVLVDGQTIVEINADGIVSRTAPADVRTACTTPEELASVMAQYAQQADTANAATIAAIAPIVAAHVPT